MAHLRRRRQAEPNGTAEKRSRVFPEDWAASTTRAVNGSREDLVEGAEPVVSMPDQHTPKRCCTAIMVKRNPGMVIYKELNWETLMKTLKDSVKDITVITIILAFSGVFGYGVVFDDLTTTIASALVSITTIRRCCCSW